MPKGGFIFLYKLKKNTNLYTYMYTIKYIFIPEIYDSNPMFNDT